jgi:hypothetical protein
MGVWPKLIVVAVLAGAASGATMQHQSTGSGPSPAFGHYSAPLPYDGRFTFVRLRWGADLPSSGRGGFASAWNHDYPRAEQHLSAIIRELTFLDVHDDGNEILTLDDPNLFKFPIALMWEPGFWNLTDRETSSFRAYLQKGGFAVFEDFDGPAQWAHFEAQMHRVLPDGRLVRLDNSHQIFNAFFAIEDIDAIVHPMSRIRPSYYGIFEDNDPAKRLMVVANFDNDVPEYWEWSGQGLFPFDASNEAYKLGVNYMIYGLTH